MLNDQGINRFHLKLGIDGMATLSPVCLRNSKNCRITMILFSTELLFPEREPTHSLMKARSFTATFGKLLYKEVQKEMWIYNIINSMHCFWFLVLFSNWWISRFYDHLYFLLFDYMGYIKYL